MRKSLHALIYMGTLTFAIGCSAPPLPTPTPITQKAPASTKGERVQHMLFFEYDSTTLPNDTLVIIAPHVRHLIQHPRTTLLIEGHADESGDKAYNQALGQKRADALKAAFIEQGISSSLILAQSQGELRPLNHQESDESHKRNRRVTITY